MKVIANVDSFERLPSKQQREWENTMHPCFIERQACATIPNEIIDPTMHKHEN